MTDKLLSELTEADFALARKAVEDALVEWRDKRFSVLANNGLVIRERDGTDSSIIRLTMADAMAIGVKAILAAGNPDDRGPG